MSARSTVPVGIIGLSPAWDVRYRPALQSLRQRIAVRAVFDPVLSRAEQAAEELGAEPASGMRTLARRSDLKALLVFDTGWSGIEALRMLCRTGRPMFVGGALSADETALERVREAAISCRAMIMPELGQRYTPATFRLRELLATRLGRPVQIEIDAASPTGSASRQPLGARPRDEFVARLADWCCYVVPTPPSEVAAAPGSDGQPERIRLDFARSRAGGESPVAEIRLRPAGSTRTDDMAGPLYHVRCERGEAEIVSESRIIWRTDTEQADESLASDRSDMQVMLDHFCRRVVGGLIPVANLDDIRRSRALLWAASESLRTGGPVHLNGRA